MAKQTIKETLLLTLANRVRQGFETVSGLALERVDPRHPMSGTRRLRELRQAGYLSYEVVDRSRSIYRITSTYDELVGALRRLREDKKCA